MSGLAKVLGIIVALSLLIRACGGKSFQEWEAEQNNKAKEATKIAESHQSDDNEISATDLLALGGNAIRVQKRFPGRFVVTGRVLKVEDHKGAWGRKTYSVDLIGTYDSRGLVDSWVICEMSKDGGLANIGPGHFVKIEGEYDRSALGSHVFMSNCWLSKKYHNY